jgi:hypothetical protein
LIVPQSIEIDPAELSILSDGDRCLLPTRTVLSETLGNCKLEILFKLSRIGAKQIRVLPDLEC